MTPQTKMIRGRAAQALLWKLDRWMLHEVRDAFGIEPKKALKHVFDTPTELQFYFRGPKGAPIQINKQKAEYQHPIA